MTRTANIGSIIGPIIGGYLSDPIASYPKIFGPGSVIGGENGVWWMQKWPYALPNLVSAVFLLASALIVILGLEEVSSPREWLSGGFSDCPLDSSCAA